MDPGTLMSESLSIYLKLRHLMQRLQNRSRFWCRANKRPQTARSMCTCIPLIREQRKPRSDLHEAPAHRAGVRGGP